MKELLLILTLNSNLNDKDLHYLAGVNIANAVGTTYYLAKPYKPFKACLVGFVAGSIVGIAKEAIWDKRLGLGNCNNEDAYVTMWGSAVGSIVLRISIHEFYGKKRTIIYNNLD